MGFDVRDNLVPLSRRECTLGGRKCAREARRNGAEEATRGRSWSAVSTAKTATMRLRGGCTGGDGEVDRKKVSRSSRNETSTETTTERVPGEFLNSRSCRRRGRRLEQPRTRREFRVFARSRITTILRADCFRVQSCIARRAVASQTTTTTTTMPPSWLLSSYSCAPVFLPHTFLVDRCCRANTSSRHLEYSDPRVSRLDTREILIVILLFPPSLPAPSRRRALSHVC